MGYSHYWHDKDQPTPDRARWDEALANVRRLLRLCPAIEMHATPEELLIDHPACETLWFPLDPGNLRPFHAVKTDVGGPGEGDAIYTAILLVMAEAGLSLRSDGYPCSWLPGQALAQKALGRPVALAPGLLDPSRWKPEFLALHQEECPFCLLALPSGTPAVRKALAAGARAWLAEYRAQYAIKAA